MLASRPLRGRAVATLAALTLGSATCAPPLQSGGVLIATGAAERLGVLCRWRGEAGTDGLCPESGAAAAAPARVRRLGADPKDRLSGPLAAGRAGDYLLENDQIAVVIDQLGPGIGFAESGGNIVDAADAVVRRDELGQVFTYFGLFPRQALYEKLSTGVDADGTAWIEVRGRELYEAALGITTRYALRPGDRAVLITTALENTGREAIGGLELGDAVEWGSAEKVAPGREPGFRGDYEGPFVAGVGASAAYALVPVEDAEIAAKNGAAWSNVSFAAGVSLPPGGRAEYARVLAVAPRGDALGVMTELFVLGGGSPGGLSVELTDARGAALGPVEGRVTLTPVNAEGALAAAPVALWLRAGSDGPAGGELAPGRYLVGFEGSGRRAIAPATVQIRAGAVAAAKLALSDAGRLRVSVREVDPGGAGAARPTPAKVMIFHADTGKPEGPPRLTATGDVEVPLAPGRYRVVASRGPELTLGEATLEVPAAGAAAAELRLARVVDTAGFLACDLHQHSALSADAGVAVADRVLSNAAEGVECAVASEHNALVDWTPAVEALGLAARLRAIPGDEITTDASREPIGHLNVFPVRPDPAAPRGGAPAARDRSARELFDAALALPGGEKVIQVNHPRSGRNGYFDQLGFDPAAGVGKAPGYDDRFDAVEVWSGRQVEGRARVLADLWGLLRAGRPVTPTGNTDTHGIVGAEPGYPRTYVAVGVDDPARLDPAMLVEALRRRRDVVITNGPFVTLRLGEVRQGALASPGKGAALTVRVERAPWVDATELQLVVGGVPGATIPLTGAATTPAGAVLDEVSVPLTLGALGRPGRAASAPAKAPARGQVAPLTITEDTFVVAIVRGQRPLEPVLSGSPDEIRPFAMTAPLWIDADGDGRALGRQR